MSGSNRWPWSGSQGAGDPENVAGAGAQVGQVGVPDVERALDQRDAQLGVVVVEHRELDPLGVLRPERDVGSHAVPAHAERMRLAGPQGSRRLGLELGPHPQSLPHPDPPETAMIMRMSVDTPACRPENLMIIAEQRPVQRSGGAPTAAGSEATAFATRPISAGETVFEVAGRTRTL